MDFSRMQIDSYSNCPYSDYTYSLPEAINTYAELLEMHDFDGTSTIEEIEFITNHTKMILAIAYSHIQFLQKDQIESIVNLTDRISNTAHFNDDIILLTFEIRQCFAAHQLLKQLPNDLKYNVYTYYEPYNFCLLDSRPKEYATSIALNKILLSDLIAPYSYTACELAQFMSILLLSIENHIKDHTSFDAFCKHLILIGNKPECTRQLQSLITAAVKRLEMKLDPSKIANCRFFHGEILSKGYDALILALTKSRKDNVDLLDFVEDYCRSILEPKKYLVRNSARALPKRTTKGLKTAFTVSYINVANDLRHFRITRNEEKEMPWKIVGYIESFSCLNALLGSCPWLNGFTPVEILAPQEMSRYISAYSNRR